MTPEEALNWLVSKAADAPVTIRTCRMDQQIYQTVVETLLKALKELEELKKRDVKV